MRICWSSPGRAITCAATGFGCAREHLEGVANRTQQRIDRMALGPRSWPAPRRNLDRLPPQPGPRAFGGDVLIRLAAGTASQASRRSAQASGRSRPGTLLPVAAWDQANPADWPEQIRPAVTPRHGRPDRPGEHADLRELDAVSPDDAARTAVPGFPRRPPPTSTSPTGCRPGTCAPAWPPTGRPAGPPWPAAGASRSARSAPPRAASAGSNGSRKPSGMTRGGGKPAFSSLAGRLLPATPPPQVRPGQRSAPRPGPTRPARTPLWSGGGTCSP